MARSQHPRFAKTDVSFGLGYLGEPVGVRIGTRPLTLSEAIQKRERLDFTQIILFLNDFCFLVGFEEKTRPKVICLDPAGYSLQR